MRTDTTLDQDCGTESNCVRTYTVQCRVIVDNKCESTKIMTLTMRDQVRRVRTCLVLIVGSLLQCFSATHNSRRWRHRCTVGVEQDPLV